MTQSGGDEQRMGDPVAAGGLTRRDTLKRIGVVGGIAWAAPVLSTVNSPAFAQQGSPPPNNVECNGQTPNCEEQTADQCGSSGPFEFCFCTVDSAGAPQCVEDQFCEDLDPCGMGDTCPTGFICVPAENNCCGEDKCTPPCGDDMGTALVTGLRLSGLTLPPIFPLPLP